MTYCSLSIWIIMSSVIPGPYPRGTPRCARPG
jgi:hypothetical protein